MEQSTKRYTRLEILSMSDIRMASTTAPMETMTKNRIYATIDYKGDVKHISFYDKENKRYKQIDLDHYHRVDGNKEKPHTHYGYWHDENGTRKPDMNDESIVDKVNRIWQNRKSSSLRGKTGTKTVASSCG